MRHDIEEPLELHFHIKFFSNCKWCQMSAQMGTKGRLSFDHGTSVKVVAKSLKGQINWKWGRNALPYHLKHLETSLQGVAASNQVTINVRPRPHLNPCAFCGSVGVWQATEWAHRNKDTFQRVDVHKIQVWRLTRNISCHCFSCFFLRTMDKSQNMDTIHSTDTIPAPELDASKSISYTTVGPSAQTVQANSRLPLVGTDKNVKQPVTDHCFMSIHRSWTTLAYRAQNHGPSIWCNWNDWGQVGVLAKRCQKPKTHAYVLPYCFDNSR